MATFRTLYGLPDWANELFTPSAWEWGDVPTWIQAVATVLAVIAASIAAVFTRRMLQVENSRDLQQKVARERMQAELIAIWVEPTTSQTATYPTPRLVDLHYANLSKLPVYDAIILLSNGKVTERIPLHTLPPTPESITREAYLDVLLKAALQRGMRRYHPIVVRKLDIRIIFSDAAGNRWARHKHGPLDPVADDYEPATAPEVPPVPPELEGY